MCASGHESHLWRQSYTIWLWTALKHQPIHGKMIFYHFLQMAPLLKHVLDTHHGSWCCCRGHLNSTLKFFKQHPRPKLGHSPACPWKLSNKNMKIEQKLSKKCQFSAKKQHGVGQRSPHFSPSNGVFFWSPHQLGQDSAVKTLSLNAVIWQVGPAVYRETNNIE